MPPAAPKAPQAGSRHPSARTARYPPPTRRRQRGRQGSGARGRRCRGFGGEAGRRSRAPEAPPETRTCGIGVGLQASYPLRSDEVQGIEMAKTNAVLTSEDSHPAFFRAGGRRKSSVGLPPYYFLAGFINQSECSPAAPKAPQAGSRRPSARTARHPPADPAPASVLARISRSGV